MLCFQGTRAAVIAKAVVFAALFLSCLDKSPADASSEWSDPSYEPMAIRNQELNEKNAIHGHTAMGAVINHEADLNIDSGVLNGKDELQDDIGKIFNSWKETDGTPAHTGLTAASEVRRTALENRVLWHIALQQKVMHVGA
jgi:hypothetical protein